MPQEDVFGDIEREGDTVNLEEEKETPTDSPAEEEPVVEEPSQEGDNTPDEEDDDYKKKTSKRVQQLLKERREEREQRIALEERLARLEQRESPRNEEIPERWRKLYSTGDPEQDVIAYQEWKALNQEERAAMKAELIAELREEQGRESAEQEQFASRYEELMDELEAEGKEFDRNALMKFISERPIFMPDGNPDFATALELMEAKKPASNLSARKKLASVNAKSTIGEKGYLTPDDLKGGWGAIN